MVVRCLYCRPHKGGWGWKGVSRLSCPGAAEAELLLDDDPVVIRPEKYLNKGLAARINYQTLKAAQLLKQL